MNKKGLTLIELILAITLVVVVIMTAFLVNILGANFLVRLNEANALQTEVNRAMLDITGEIMKGNRYWWPGCWSSTAVGAPGATAALGEIFIQQDEFGQYGRFLSQGVTVGNTAGDYMDGTVAGVDTSNDVIVHYLINGNRIVKNIRVITTGASITNPINEEIAGTDLVWVEALEFIRINYNAVNVRIRVGVNPAMSTSGRQLTYITRVVLRGTTRSSPI